MKETRPIHVYMKLESPDVLRFFFKMFLAKSRFMMFGSIIILGLLFPMLTLLLIQSLVLDGPRSVSLMAYLPLIVEGIVMFFILYVVISSKKNAKPIHLIFTEEEIEIISPKITSRISWSNYNKAQETRLDFFLLSASPNSSLPIPKRFFDSEMEIQTFRELVREKLGDKADLKIN